MLLVMMRSKELKTKIYSHADSLILPLTACLTLSVPLLLPACLCFCLLALLLTACLTYMSRCLCLLASASACLLYFSLRASQCLCLCFCLPASASACLPLLLPACLCFCLPASAPACLCFCCVPHSASHRSGVSGQSRSGVSRRRPQSAKSTKQHTAARVSNAYTVAKVCMPLSVSLPVSTCLSASVSFRFLFSVFSVSVSSRKYFWCC